MDKNCRQTIKLIDIVAKRTMQIAQNPFAYRLTDFKDNRVATLKNYSIFYKVADDKITITSFWDNRQNPKKLLTLLKK